MALTTVRPEGMGFNTGRRNMVINGAMQVAQRGTSATNPGGGYNTLDRWRFSQNSGGLGDFTAAQSTDVPSGEGFSTSLKMTNSSAKTVTSAMTCFIQQKFEGQDLQQLKYGASSAESVTLSFYVRSSVTGTFCCHLFQSGNDRAHVKEYTISSANTFEKKTLTFTGDTASSLANDNSEELCVSWVLGAGSSAHLSADAWTSATSSKGWCTSNQTNWITTNGATFYITGVQLELGENASDFEHRSYGEELALCQRYFWRSTGGNFNAVASGNNRSTTLARVFLPNPQIMRSAPTISISGTMRGSTGGGNQDITTIDEVWAGSNSSMMSVQSSSLTSGYGFILHHVNNSSNYIQGDSEL